MKNFPHQYGDFLKLRGTLATIRDLNGRSLNVGDDGVLGYELTRRGINTLREHPELPLEERISRIQRRPPGNQGPRTAARELRRTLRYLGWLDDMWRLTGRGEAFLATDDAPGQLAEWQRALIDLAVEDEDGNVSHPVRVLLRLVGDHEIVQRQGAELALEAVDDSDREYQRISLLVGLSEVSRITAIGSTAPQVRNARKILPKLAEQANLIHRTFGGAPYTLTDEGRAALGEGYTARPIELERDRRPAAPRRRTRGAPRTARSDRIRRDAAGDPEGWATLSREEQIAATRLRFERTRRHQDVVAALLELLEEDGVELFEDSASFDLLRVPGEPALLRLYEVKTLETDDLTQTRLAIGQLLSYEHLNVRPRYPDRDVERAVVYERAVDEELCALLDVLEIGAYAIGEGLLQSLNETAAHFE